MGYNNYILNTRRNIMALAIVILALANAYLWQFLYWHMTGNGGWENLQVNFHRYINRRYLSLNYSRVRGFPTAD
jgi:hypothetical protein